MQKAINKENETEAMYGKKIYNKQWMVQAIDNYLQKINELSFHNYN